MGSDDGLNVVSGVGKDDGSSEGNVEGVGVGCSVGNFDGLFDGLFVGFFVGVEAGIGVVGIGMSVASCVVGRCVGAAVSIFPVNAILLNLQYPPSPVYRAIPSASILSYSLGKVRRKFVDDPSDTKASVRSRLQPSHVSPV